MSNTLKETRREDHSNFEHEGHEGKYQDWCPLCKKIINEKLNDKIISSNSKLQRPAFGQNY
jgi:hypothetical protein